MDRRQSLKWLLGFTGLPLAGAIRAEKSKGTGLRKSKDQWAALLPPAAYRVLFEEATERAGTSPLNHEKRDGTFVCAACNLPLFDSRTKYDSGTGWPSFWQPIPEAVRTRNDDGWFSVRTEVHCRRCGGHLGHVFPDGPKPTGKRYCMNGVALAFRAA